MLLAICYSKRHTYARQFDNKSLVPVYGVIYIYCYALYDIGTVT